MSDIPRYRPAANDKYGIADDADGKLCEYRDYARLKAENARLKTEVEHLMVFCNCTLIPSKELQAEVERLRKAGDAMASSIQFNEEMIQDYNGPTIVHKCVQRWNAAKEGKPSV